MNTKPPVLVSLVLLIASAPLIAQCVPSPTGISGWWPLDETSGTTAADIVGPGTGTISGATPTTGLVGGAFAFAGNGQDVQLPGTAFGADTQGTLEMWVKPQPGNSYIGAYKLNGLAFLINNAFGSLALQQLYTGNAPAQGFTGAPIVAGSWHHVAFVSDGLGTPYRVYLDGVQLSAGVVNGSGYLPGAWFADVGAGEDLFLGKARAASLFLNGALDEVAVYNRALTSAEIQSLHAAGSSGKCPPPSVSVLPHSCGSVTMNYAGTPQIGTSSTFSLIGAAGLPFVFYSMGRIDDASLCAPCVLGPRPNVAASGVLFGASFTLSIPADPLFVGNPFFIQGIDLGASGPTGCVSIPAEVTDTVALVIGA